jgi:hypothetical protein
MMSVADFDESTAFERFALESTAALRATENRRSAYLDLRTGEARVFGYATAALGGGGTEKLRLDLRPLMFGAAWKIIDLAVVFAIGAATDKTVQIADKVKAARMCTPPGPLAAQLDVWLAIVECYDATQELRNGLVHRKADVMKDRTLSVKRKKSNQVDAMDADQQLAFCRLSQLVARVIISGQLDERTLFDISDQLCLLGSYSQFNTRIGRDTRRVFELVTDVETVNGAAIVDVPQLMQATKASFPDAVYVDLVGVLDDAGNVITGALDTAEQRVHSVTLSALPDWLRLEKRVASG